MFKTNKSSQQLKNKHFQEWYENYKDILDIMFKNMRRRLTDYDIDYEDFIKFVYAQSSGKIVKF